MRLVSALAIALALATAAMSTASAANVKLLETGSSLLYPLMNQWVDAYQKSNSGVQITTQSTGSGTGISQAVAGIAQIGASDAYMADAQMKTSPMLNIPLAISAQQINYNLPGLNHTHLRLSGPVLAAIYSGGITYWDDSRIKQLNARVARELPHKAIVPIHRADGSGDTFLFTQYLSFSTPSWNRSTGYGTTVSWPAVQTAVGANGNPGMVQTCQNTPYSIAYIGVSFLNETNKAGLGYAALLNRSGRYVLPTATSIAAAAASLEKKTPSHERISLIYAPGAASYPIINYEYAVVNPRQSDAATSAALKKFLTWTLSPQGGQRASFLGSVHFLPLPAGIARLSLAQVHGIR